MRVSRVLASVSHVSRASLAIRSSRQQHARCCCGPVTWCAMTPYDPGCHQPRPCALRLLAVAPRRIAPAVLGTRICIAQHVRFIMVARNAPTWHPSSGGVARSQPRARHAEAASRVALDRAHGEFETADPGRQVCSMARRLAVGSESRKERGSSRGHAISTLHIDDSADPLHLGFRGCAAQHAG